MGRVAIIGEIVQMVLRRRTWFLIPSIIVLLFVGALILLAEVTPLGPALYPLF